MVVRGRASTAALGMILALVSDHEEDRKQATREHDQTRSLASRPKAKSLPTHPSSPSSSPTLFFLVPTLSPFPHVHTLICLLFSIIVVLPIVEVALR